MGKEQAYCQAPGCEEPTKEGRRFCPRDTKRFQRRRAGKSAPALGAPPVERLPPMERAIELMGQLVETPAEDDDLYQRRRRELEQVLLELGKKARPEAIRRGMARARASGKHVGRPPKVSANGPIRALVHAVGLARAAQALGLDRRTLRRALTRDHEGTLSAQPVREGARA